jgi:predicted GNAT family acetyltransferase
MRSSYGAAHTALASGRAARDDGGMGREFANERDEHRYTLRIDGELACVVDYTINNNSISMTRTFTRPDLRGKGYAAELVTHAVDDVEKNTTCRVVPMCWYVAEWFDRHPEREGLLTR